MSEKVKTIFAMIETQKRIVSDLEARIELQTARETTL